MPTRLSSVSSRKKECKMRMRRSSLTHTILINRELTMMYWAFQRMLLLMKSRKPTGDSHSKIIPKTNLEIKRLKGNSWKSMKLTTPFPIKPDAQTMMTSFGEVWCQSEPIISSKILWVINSSISQPSSNSSSPSLPKSGRGIWTG